LKECQGERKRKEELQHLISVKRGIGHWDGFERDEITNLDGSIEIMKLPGPERPICGCCLQLYNG
jgi:hypothetical protein